MRVPAALCCLALLVACAPAEPEPAAEAVVAAPALTVADFAGTWQLTTTLAGVEAPVMSQISGTAAGSDWTMALEGRDPIALMVSVAGDSLISESSEYESILRKGVMVRTRTAGAMSGGMLHGTITATYRTTTGDELVTGTFTGSRLP